MIKFNRIKILKVESKTTDKLHLIKLNLKMINLKMLNKD